MRPPKTFLFVIALCSSSVHLQDAARVDFSCQGRASGYYADVPSGCQIYHMCDTLGRQFSYTCPNTTLFQQRMLICDHWYMVNCSKSEVDYDANLLIGQRGKPFVADDDEHPYYRTPRPDLLAHPSSSEYNIIFRAGRAHDQQNLVGAAYNEDDGTVQPAYFLPSHWSTQQRSSNQIEAKPLKTKKPIINVNFESNFVATTPVYPKLAPAEVPLAFVDDDVHRNVRLTGVLLPPPKQPEQPPPNGAVNFPSNFRATTPVYPKFVTPERPLAEEEPRSEPKSSYGLSSIVEPPKGGIKNGVGAQTRSAPSRSDGKVVVNYASNFKATTPVYPASVPSEIPLAVEEPLVDPNVPSISTVIQPPRGFTQTGRNTLLQASVIAQATKVDVNWNELRRILLIPDFQFPLDASAARPNYDHGPSSFHVQPVTFEVRQRKHAHL